MPYDEKKFKEFNRLLTEANAEAVIVHHPEVLGDNYEELVENLNRLASSGKQLAIVPPGVRDQKDDPFNKPPWTDL